MVTSALLVYIPHGLFVCLCKLVGWPSIYQWQETYCLLPTFFLFLTRQEVRSSATACRVTGHGGGDACTINAKFYTILKPVE